MKRKASTVGDTKTGKKGRFVPPSVVAWDSEHLSQHFRSYDSRLGKIADSIAQTGIDGRLVSRSRLTVDDADALGAKNVAGRATPCIPPPLHTTRSWRRLCDHVECTPLSPPRCSSSSRNVRITFA